MSDNMQNYYYIISLIISFSAIIISGLTAYQTFFSKFRGEIFIQPRIILTQIQNKVAIVIGCNIYNLGSQTGSIEDIILEISSFNDGGRTSNTFFPLLIKDNYSTTKKYEIDDFDSFLSIFIPSKKSLTKYLIFISGNDNYIPTTGANQIKITFRNNYNSERWFETKPSKISINITEEFVRDWLDPEGESILIETNENFAKRSKKFLNSQ